MLLLQSNFSLFVGQLHPLLVHLPIGFLLLAGIFFYLGKKRKYQFLHSALPLTLFLSAISAIVAALFGWFLANSGGYEDSTLFWHRWLGIGVAVLATLAWLSAIGVIGQAKKLLPWLMLPIILLLSATGHLGGTLTHGQGYLLNNAPLFLQKLFGTSENQAGVAANFPENPDSIRIYQHLIQPVFDQKCISCHNETKKKGDLLLASKEGLLAGGDHGPVLVKAAPLESELVHRVSMNADSKKFMPPNGIPMTYHEIKLLDFWIANGMSFDLNITDKTIPPDIKALIEKQYGLSSRRKAYVEIKTVPPAASEVIEAIQAAGFSINPLANNTNFLDVSMRGSLTLDKMKALSKIGEQLTWLNLGNTDLQDDWMAQLSQFPNLTRLRLEKNTITDAGLQHLSQLEHLASLNLYGTAVSDEGLQSLEGMRSLQKLFLWQTKVTPDGAAALQQKLPSLAIDLGLVAEKIEN